jgi:integrase
VKLTQRFVDTADMARDREEDWYMDDEVRGFGLRLQRGKKGVTRTYMIRYKRSRKLRVGDPSRMSLVDARKEARRLLTEVDKGVDPAAQRKADAAEPTLAEVAGRFLQHQENRKRKSWKKMKGSMDAYILPALGQRRMRDLSQTDAQELHNQITAQGKATHANRVLALLSSLWSYYERTRLKKPGEPRWENPCRFIERNPETKRERYLSREELDRLGDALRQAEEKGAHPSAMLAIRLLALTGARKSEILTLKREWVDFQRGLAFLPTSKTGQKVLPLGEAALFLIQEAAEKVGNPYVCWGEGAGPFGGLQRIWNTIRDDAKLPGVRIHDLRHTFASVGVGSGHGLPIVGRILGHTSWQTTERYSHLGDSPVRTAVNSISGEIGAKLLPFKATQAA